MKQEAIEKKQPELKLVVEQHKEEEKANLEKNESTASSEEKSAALIERPDNKELEAPDDEPAACEANEVIEKPDEEEKDGEQGKPLCTNL